MNDWQEITNLDAQVKYKKVFDAQASDSYLHDLIYSHHWKQDYIQVAGKKTPLPRLQQMYGDEDLVYEWSNITMLTEKWTPTLLKLKEIVEVETNSIYNSVLLNCYRDGRDTVGWHADNEPELGQNPIASLSFGAERDFILRHNETKQKISLPLEHGSLLLMAGDCQQKWQHSLPRRTRITSERVNLTFRKIETI